MARKVLPEKAVEQDRRLEASEQKQGFCSYEAPVALDTERGQP